MKKKLKFSIFLLILLLVVGGKIYATTSVANLTINMNTTKAKVGEIVTMKVSVDCETGIEGIDAALEYDNTKLELQNINIISKFSNMSGEDETTGEYKLTVISNTTETVKQADFATIDFKVLDLAQVGEKTTIKLSNIEIGDSQDEWMEVDDKIATIEVIEEPQGEDDKEPGTEDTNPGEDDKKPETEDTNPGEDDKKPETEDSKPSEEDKKPGTEDKKPTEDNKKPATEDKTQADKVIVPAGLETYGLTIIAIIFIVAYVSYKKYKGYKNV